MHIHWHKFQTTSRLQFECREVDTYVCRCGHKKRKSRNIRHTFGQWRTTGVINRTTYIDDDPPFYTPTTVWPFVGMAQWKRTCERCAAEEKTWKQ